MVNLTVQSSALEGTPPEGAHKDVLCDQHKHPKKVHLRLYFKVAFEVGFQLHLWVHLLVHSLLHNIIHKIMSQHDSSNGEYDG